MLRGIVGGRDDFFGWRGEIVGAGAEIGELPGQIDEWSGSVVNTSGQIVFTSASLLFTSRQIICVSRAEHSATEQSISTSGRIERLRSLVTFGLGPLNDRAAGIADWSGRRSQPSGAADEWLARSLHRTTMTAA